MTWYVVGRDSYGVWFVYGHGKFFSYGNHEQLIRYGRTYLTQQGADRMKQKICDEGGRWPILALVCAATDSQAAR